MGARGTASAVVTAYNLNTGRNPRSLLLCSHRTTAVPVSPPVRCVFAEPKQREKFKFCRLDFYMRKYRPANYPHSTDAPVRHKAMGWMLQHKAMGWRLWFEASVTGLWDPLQSCAIPQNTCHSSEHTRSLFEPQLLTQHGAVWWCALRPDTLSWAQQEEEKV